MAASFGSISQERRPLFVAPVCKDGKGNPRISRVLIANRGEIALRIIATCKKLGVTSISIYTEEDRDSLHIREADEAVSIGSIQEASLNPHIDIDLLIKTSLSLRADAIHPGYGYLSENADFAQKVQDAGLIFIGPTPHAIQVLGDKRQAKEFLMQHAPEIPLIPGYNGKSQDVTELELEAEKIGFPLLIKAAAGGGGKGMRIVRKKEELRDGLLRAQSEAQRSFGSSDCLLEKYIERGKHIEVQMIGDSTGEVITLFDRECSVQRRHQKIIEEAPSPWLRQEVRERMLDAAKSLGVLLKYESAGTVEFMVDVDTANFYFLEVNTRIQVEHAITEEITGVDIVALQFFIASGGKLSDCGPIGRSSVGHAIECRLCAENPEEDFMPDTGVIRRWTPGTEILDVHQRTNVRIETAVCSGSKVSVYFDSMIAKIVVWAPDRAIALRKMVDVLKHTMCIGIRTNHLFLQACLASLAFQKVDYTTNFIPENLHELLQNPYTKDLSENYQRFSVIPALFKRWQSSNSPEVENYRPFKGISSGFRNQVEDSRLSAANIVTVNGGKSGALFMLTWCTRRDARPNQFSYSLQTCIMPAYEPPQSKKNLKPGAELVRHFEESMRQLRAKSTEDSGLYVLSLIDCRMVQHKHQGLDPWFTADLTFENNGRRIRSHLTQYSIISQGSTRSERIYCHIPDLGTSIEYCYYTALQFGESLRAGLGNTEEIDTLRSFKSPMPCRVLRILKQKGEAIKKGEKMLVIESMKTEMDIIAAVDGIFMPMVAEGDAVSENVLLCEIV